MIVTVPAPPSFQFRSTLLSHGWLELAPYSHDEGFTQLRRIHRLVDGQVADVRFEAGPNQELIVTADLGSPDELTRLAHRVFNLDVDLTPLYGLLKRHKRYAWVQKHGAGRLLRAATVWEDLAKTLLTTNTTWAMTKQMVRRLTEMGDHAEAGYTFPTPAQVANQPFEVVAEQVRAGYRNEYLFDLAAQLADGTVNPKAWLDEGLSAEMQFRRLGELRGFGPYAAGAALKLLGRYDYLALDSAARSMFTDTFHEGERPTDDVIRAHYEGYGEWKGLVLWMDLMHDWIVARKGT